jgi:uncharacterized iron-regulated protein
MAAQKALHLAIGDPERRDREIPLTLDAITDTRTGELLTPGELAPRLAGVKLLLVGESHTDMEFHRVQLRVLEELHAAGREVLIGLEMFPYTEQTFLDQWVQGLLTEDGFVELSHWYGKWGYNWKYYRDIFLLARAEGIRMFAVNAPREVVRAVRKKGFKDLTEDEATHIPTEIDTDNDEHRQLIRTLFEDEEALHAALSEEQLDRMFAAQCTWDATMGHNAVRALEQHGDDDTMMVVLAGAGHVAYGLGIQRQAAQWYDGDIAALIPVPVRDDGQPVQSVRASFAEFVWGLPFTADPLFPVLGLSATDLKDEEFRKVIYVGEDSVAEEAGFQIGDVLLRMDGVPLLGREPLMRLMADKRWGDAARFEVRRGEQTVEVPVFLRRRGEAEEQEDKEEQVEP